MSSSAFDELGAKVLRAQSIVREIRGVGRAGGIAVHSAGIDDPRLSSVQPTFHSSVLSLSGSVLGYPHLSSDSDERVAVGTKNWDSCTGS